MARDHVGVLKLYTMAIHFTEGIYPYVTLVMDATGCLHMFEGEVTPSESRSLPTVQGREAETFVQWQADIEAITDYLSAEEREELSYGYAIQTKHIPDDFLVHE